MQDVLGKEDDYRSKVDLSKLYIAAVLTCLTAGCLTAKVSLREIYSLIVNKK